MREITIHDPGVTPMDVELTSPPGVIARLNLDSHFSWEEGGLDMHVEVVDEAAYRNSPCRTLTVKTCGGLHYYDLEESLPPLEVDEEDPPLKSVDVQEKEVDARLSEVIGLLDKHVVKLEGMLKQQDSADISSAAKLTLMLSAHGTARYVHMQDDPITMRIGIGKRQETYTHNGEEWVFEEESHEKRIDREIQVVTTTMPLGGFITNPPPVEIDRVYLGEYLIVEVRGSWVKPINREFLLTRDTIVPLQLSVNYQL